MSKLKDDLLDGAMKALQSPTAQKIMNNKKVQKGMAKAFKASYELKTELDEKKEEFARKFDLATRDDLRTLKRDLDRMERQVEYLKRQQRENDSE